MSRFTAPRPIRALVLSFVALIALPASGQIRLGSNGIYGVAVERAGAYTAKTGPQHPGPVGENLFYAGEIDDPWSSFNSFRSYDSNREFYLAVPLGLPPNPSPGFACSALGGGSVEDILTGTTVTGIRNRWRLVSGPDALSIVQEVNAEGTTFDDSVVRITFCIRNDGALDPARVGIRFEWDWQMGSTDGPYIGIRPPHPPAEPFLAIERDFPNPTFDFYDVSDMQSPTTTPPLYRVGGTVLNPQLGLGPTPPELLQYAEWPGVGADRGAYTTCFTYNTAAERIGGVDSAVLYYWGATPATAIELSPGEEFCATQYVFAFSVAPPPLCFADARAVGGTGCDPGTILIDASTSTATDCPGVLEYSFTDPTGRLAEDWSTDAFHDADVSGTWIVDVRCDANPNCSDTQAVDVQIDQTPLFDPPRAADAASCNLGVELTWDAATFRDAGSGSYNVYRSEVGCADPSPQLVEVGLSDLRFVDATTVAGGTYYYFVEAEDGQPATTCSPAGPANGGSTNRWCVGPVTDVGDPAPPEGVCYTLRMSHRADSVTADWSLARALLAGEHFHLLKAPVSPEAPFVLANPEADLSLSHVEVDISASPQFFDLRVANACEVTSGDDEPPSLTGAPQPCP